jgi:hypothetical protein
VDEPRITAQSFPMPDIEKTTLNPAAWDQWDAVGRAMAAEANTVRELLQERLAGARTGAERVAAFHGGHEHVAEWVRQTFAARTGTSPSTPARVPIDDRRGFQVSPAVEEQGTPAYSTRVTFHNLAMARLRGAEMLQNVVDLRYGRQVNGNLVVRIPEGQATHPLQAGEIMAITATHEDRELLRQECFGVLADLVGKRTGYVERSLPEPSDRQAFADASYYLIQGPELTVGSDSSTASDLTMRTFLAAAHTQVFNVPPLFPQAMDLHGMVRSQSAFGRVMQTELGFASASAAPSRTVDSGSERTTNGRIDRDRRSGLDRAGD